MNTRQLEYFIAVADFLNFTKAAEKFFISQTAISLQIKSLEELLGVQLFIRNNKKVTLTAAGREFYKEAKHILTHINEAIIDTKRISAGFNESLKIGFSTSFDSKKLYILTNEFCKTFPDIDISIIEGSVEFLLDKLNHNAIDILFTVDFNSSDFPEFNCKKVFTSKSYLVISKDNPLAQNTKISLKNLKNQNIITLDRALYRYEFDNLISKCVQAGFSPNIVKQCLSINSLLLMVSLNLGITFSYMVPNINYYSNLSFISLDGLNEYSDSMLLWNPINTNPSINLFLESIH